MNGTPTTDATTRSTSTARTIVRYLPAVARVLLGAMFTFAGGYGLFGHPTPPPGLPAAAIAFNAALTNTGYMLPLISATQALVGLLLLTNRFVPLALALLAPIVVNILAFHLFLEPSGRPMAVIVAAITAWLAWQYRTAYRPMLSMRTARAGDLAVASVAPFA